MGHKEISKIPFEIYWWFFQVAVVLGLASVVVWLSLIPKSPSFTIMDAYIRTLNDTNSTAHQSEVASKNSLVFVLQILNPNKGMGIYYNDIFTTLFDNDATTGMKSIPAFYQGHRKSRFFDVSIDGDQQFWRKIINRVLDLRLRVKTSVKYKVFRWKTKDHGLVLEGNVTIDPKGKIYGEKSVRLRPC